MANELDAIKARLGERNVSDAEIGKLVGQAVNSGAEPQVLAEVLQAAYAKMGNKEIAYDPKEIKAEKQTVSDASTHARKRLAKKKEMTGSDEAKNGSVSKRLKRVKDKPAQDKVAEKAAEKEAKKKAKDAKAAKKEKKGLNKIAKDEKTTIDKSNKNDKDLAKLKEKEEKEKRKGEKGKDTEPKTASDKEKQMAKKLEPLKMQGLDISESGAYWMLNVQTPHGKVQVNVTDAVENLRNINAQIDKANDIIENANNSKVKPDVSLSPQSATIGGQGVKAPDEKGVATPDVPAAPVLPTAAPEVPTASSSAIDAVKRETFAAELANFKDVDGTRLGDKLSEKDLKFIAKTALERFNDEKILKKLKEKEEQEKKKSRNDKSQSPNIHPAERGRGE